MNIENKLTEREETILDLLIRGKANKQIALDLSISEKTVEMHLCHIYRKLNVGCRGEAILFYFTKIREIPY